MCEERHIVVISFILILISCVESNNTVKFIENEAPGKYDSLTNCIAKVAKRENLSKSTMLIFQNDEMASKESLNFASEMSNKLITENVPTVIVQNISDLIETRYIDNVSIVCLIYYENCEELSKFEEIILDENMRFIVIISNFSDEACKYFYSKLAVMTSEFHVTYFTINLSDKEHKVLSFLPELNSITCKLDPDTKPTHINSCINNELLKGTVFPLKSATNFHKCPMRVGVGNLHPFAVIKSYNKLQDLELIPEIKGCDYEVIKIVAAKINAALKVHKITTSANNAFSKTEFIKYLENGSLDLCAGGLYRIYGDTVKYSGIYGRQVIIWTYAVERDQRSLKNLVERIDGLYIFFLFYIYYSLVWYFLCWFEDQRMSVHLTLLYSFGTMIGAANLQRARTTKQKIVNGLYLILCIYTVAYINIQLYSFLTISDPPTTYKTNDAVMNSGKKLYINPYAKNFVDDPKFLDFINNTENCEDFIDCERKALATKSMTVLLDGQFIEFQAMTAENDEAKFLRTVDNVLTIYHEMPVYKDSLVLESLQNIMMRLKEAGIMDKLYNEALGILNVSKSEVFTKNTLTNSYYCEKGCKITLLDFSAAFYLLFFGSGIAFLIFTVEVISVKYQKI